MKETTCKKLQEIGAFALAGGCTPKRMKQLVEMIRAARNYRWVGGLQNRQRRIRDSRRNGQRAADLSAFSHYPGAMRRGTGLGETGHRR